MTYEDTVKPKYRSVEKWHRLLNRLSGWPLRGVPRDYWNLAAGSESGHVVPVLHRVPREAVAEAAAYHYRTTAGNETVGHAFMKRAALAWMRMDGFPDANDEVQAHGFRLDTYSAEKRWVIECGHTNPERIIALACAMGRPHHIMLLPFRHNCGQIEDWTDGKLPPLCAVEIWISPEFTDAYQQVRMRRLREASLSLDLSVQPTPAPPTQDQTS